MAFATCGNWCTRTLAGRPLDSGVNAAIFTGSKCDGDTAIDTRPGAEILPMNPFSRDRPSKTSIALVTNRMQYDSSEVHWEKDKQI